MIFGAMMRKTPEERLLMGFHMAATARALVWSRLEKQEGGTEDERQKSFYQHFHGAAPAW